MTLNERTKHFTGFLNIIFIAISYWVEYRTVYITWLCETLSCLTNSRGRTDGGRKETQPQRNHMIVFNANWLRSSLCESDEVKRSLWPPTWQEVTPRQEAEKKQAVWARLRTEGGKRCFWFQNTRIHLLSGGWQVHSQVLNVVIDSFESLLKKDKVIGTWKMQLRKQEHEAFRVIRERPWERDYIYFIFI